MPLEPTDAAESRLAVPVGTPGDTGSQRDITTAGSTSSALILPAHLDTGAGSRTERQDDPVVAPSSSGETSGQQLSHVPRFNSQNASVFADFAISQPGLGVINAKISIFQTILGPDQSLDFWNLWAPSPIYLGVATKLCPPNLEPTFLQRNVEHHAIIDAFPWPSFRDRLLYTMTLPSESRPPIARRSMVALTVDLISAAKDVTGGIRVHGVNALSADGWEIGQTFYSMFWWALDVEIVKRSNRWRMQRGETILCHDV